MVGYDPSTGTTAVAGTAIADTKSTLGAVSVGDAATGKFRQDTLDRWAADEFAMQPNHVVDSVADLPDLMGL